MSRKSIGEKRQSFSMRKLSVGLVSVTVSSFFLMSQGIQSVSADNMESPIHYKYMTEGELTDEEKSEARQQAFAQYQAEELRKLQDRKRSKPKNEASAEEVPQLSLFD